MVIVGICGSIGSGKSALAELLCAVDPPHTLHLETSTIISRLAEQFNQALLSSQTAWHNTAQQITVANSAITMLLPQLSEMAGRSVDLAEVQIDSADLAVNPGWYEKLFDYLAVVSARPEILHDSISAANKNRYRSLLQWIGGYFLYKLDNQLIWYAELLRQVAAADPWVQLTALTAPRQPAEAQYIQERGGLIVKITRPGIVADTTEFTERLVADIEQDITVYNDGSVEQLATTAHQLYTDLLAGHASRRYNAYGEA